MFKLGQKILDKWHERPADQKFDMLVLDHECMSGPEGWLTSVVDGWAATERLVSGLLARLTVAYYDSVWTVSQCQPS